MEKISIVYWTQTGNTKEMADAIKAGVESAGAQADVLEVSAANAEELLKANAFALGCPAMGAEELEEEEMEPFVESIVSGVAGKKIALFGSYGWGDGEWMRSWEERMKAAGAEIISGEGVICAGSPDGEATAKCEELGRKLAENQ